MVKINSRDLNDLKLEVARDSFGIINDAFNSIFHKECGDGTYKGHMYYAWVKWKIRKIEKEQDNWFLLSVENDEDIIYFIDFQDKGDGSETITTLGKFETKLGAETALELAYKLQGYPEGYAWY